jgi:hypothetical protein
LGENSKAEAIASKFFALAMLNGFLALIFTIPILIPSLCIATPLGAFGCKSTIDINWPGTWVLVAWLVFAFAGVAGTLFWGCLYYFRGALAGKTLANKTLSWLHLILYEIGVFGATGMMAAIGFVGGSALAQGYSAAIAAQYIQDNIIPPLSSDPNSLLNDMPPVIEAVFIVLTILGALVGFISLMRMKSEMAPQAS